MPGDFRKSGLLVSLDVNAQPWPTSPGKHIQVPKRLRQLDGSKARPMPRNGEVWLGISGNLERHAARRQSSSPSGLRWTNNRSSADFGIAIEIMAEAVLFRDLLELRAWVGDRDEAVTRIALAHGPFDQIEE